MHFGFPTWQQVTTLLSPTLFTETSATNLTVWKQIPPTNSLNFSNVVLTGVQQGQKIVYKSTNSSTTPENIIAVELEFNTSQNAYLGYSSGLVQYIKKTIPDLLTFKNNQPEFNYTELDLSNKNITAYEIVGQYSNFIFVIESSGLSRGQTENFMLNLTDAMS